MSTVNDDQKTFWEEFATVWVDQQEELDGLMAPVLDEMLDRADLADGQTVLDIGCGTGTSALRAVELVGPSGHVVAADISEPMLAYARTRVADTGNLRFLTADVADYGFDDACFDRVISRFGVMFFAEPVAAFANIRRAMKPGGRIVMACWGRLDANPWFRVPMYAAKAQLGAPPPVDPDAPGPLAFRDVARVTSILNAAGFEETVAEVKSLMLTPPGDLRGVATHAASIGPARRTVDHFGASEADIAAIVDRVVEEMADYMTPDGARVPAEINFFSACAPQK